MEIIYSKLEMSDSGAWEHSRSLSNEMFFQVLGICQFSVPFSKGGQPTGYIERREIDLITHYNSAYLQLYLAGGRERDISR